MVSADGLPLFTHLYRREIEKKKNVAGIRVIGFSPLLMCTGSIKFSVIVEINSMKSPNIVKPGLISVLSVDRFHRKIAKNCVKPGKEINWI